MHNIEELLALFVFEKKKPCQNLFVTFLVAISLGQIEAAEAPRIDIGRNSTNLLLNYHFSNTQGVFTLLHTSGMGSNRVWQPVSKQNIPASGNGAISYPVHYNNNQGYFLLLENAYQPMESTQTIGPSDKEQIIDVKGRMRIILPAGLLTNSALLAISSIRPDPEMRELEGGFAGEILQITLGREDRLAKPLTIELSYDPKMLDPRLPPENSIAAAYWIPEEKQWSVVDVTVDPQNRVIRFQTDHLSWWTTYYKSNGYDVRSAGRFRVVYAPNNLAQPFGAKGHFGTNFMSIRDFAQELAIFLQEANTVYTNWFLEGRSSWAYVDFQYTEATWQGMTGNILLPDNFTDRNAAREEVAHELFHSVQNRHYNVYAAGDSFSITDRKWWHEACADFASQSLVVGAKPPFRGVMKPNFFALPLTLTTIDRKPPAPELDNHEYAVADFLGFIFDQSGGKVTFQGQFNEIASISVTDSVLNRLNAYIGKVWPGNSLPELYRRFAANLFFNKQSYQPSWDPWSKPINVLDKPTLPSNQKSFIGSFTLPANYTASLLAIQIQADPPIYKRNLRVRIIDLVNAHMSAFDMGSAIRMDREPMAYNNFTAKGHQADNSFDNGDYLCLLAVNTTSSDGSVTFAIEEPEMVTVPQIWDISPTAGFVGTNVTITGTGFGASQKNGGVKFNLDRSGIIVEWSETRIVARVPEGATTGNVVVFTGSESNLVSNGVLFTVRSLRPRITAMTASYSSSTWQYTHEIRITGGTPPYYVKWGAGGNILDQGWISGTRARALLVASQVGQGAIEKLDPIINEKVIVGYRVYASVSDSLGNEAAIFGDLGLSTLFSFYWDDMMATYFTEPASFPYNEPP